MTAHARIRVAGWEEWNVIRDAVGETSFYQPIPNEDHDLDHSRLTYFVSEGTIKYHRMGMPHPNPEAEGEGVFHWQLNTPDSDPILTPALVRTMAQGTSYVGA